MNKSNQLAKLDQSGEPYIIYKSQKGFDLYTNFSKKAEFYSMQLIIGESVKVPTLVIHHSDDNCVATPFNYAKKFFEGLKAPSKMFKAYSGGFTSGGECGPFNYHGFEGIEENVVEDMVNWIENISRKEWLSSVVYSKI